MTAFERAQKILEEENEKKFQQEENFESQSIKDAQEWANKTGQKVEVETKSGNNTFKRVINPETQQASFSYGSGDTTVRGFAQRFFGNDVEANLEGIAKTVIPNFKAEKGADIGSYTFNASDIGLNEFKDGKSVGIGRYLANYLNKFNAPGMDDARTQAEQKIREGINDMSFNSSNVMSSFDQTNKYNVRHRNINRELDAMGSSYDINFLKSDNVKRINKKLNSVESLSASKDIDINGQKVSEVDIFNQVKNQVNSMKGQFAEILANNGYEADNPFDSDFGRNEGQHQVAYKAAYDRQEFLNYDVNEKGILTKIENQSSGFDYLSNAKKLNDFKRAEEAFAEYDFYNYLEKNKDAFYGSSDAEALYNLHKSGAKLSTETENILFGFAASKNLNLEEGNAVIENLKSAATQEFSKYNIDTNNVQYLKEGGLQLTQEDGKFKLSQSSIDLMTDDERNNKYKKLIDSNDVGRENLSEIGGALDRRYRENKVLESIQSNYKNKNTIQKTVEEVTEIEKVTDPGYYRYESVTSKVQGDDIGIDINSYGYSPSGKLNKRINPGNEKIVRNSEMYDSNYNIEVTSGIRNADVNEIIKENPDITLEELKAQTDPVWINQNTNINPYNIENNRVVKDNINLYKGEDNFNTDFSVNAYVNGPSQTITTMQMVENVEPTIVKDKVTTSKTVDEVTDIFADAPNSFSDIREGASSNYDRITKSYATEDYEGYSLSNDEVLKRSGVTDEKLRKEIAGAKSFDDLSPEAMGALYKANGTLSDNEILLGGIKAEDIAQIEKNNPELAKKLANMTAEQKRELIENHLGITRDGLPKKLEFSRNKALDINDKDTARKILEKLTSEHPEKSLAEIINFTGDKNGYGDYGQATEVINAFKKGKLDEGVRSKRVEKMFDIVRETIGEIKEKHGAEFSKEYDKFDARMEKLEEKFDYKKQAKNFTNEQINGIIDEGIKVTAERSKELSGPLKRSDDKMLNGAGKFFSGNKGKLIGGALGIGAVFGVAAIASNASEERERKRQEMNQLLAMQSANIRGGY